MQATFAKEAPLRGTGQSWEASPCEQRGQWRTVMLGGRLKGGPAAEAGGASSVAVPLYAELGCGKGRFLVGMAKRYPEALFLGIEGHQGVLLRAAQKLHEEGIGNAKVLHAYIHDIRDYFGEGELAGLYLNFSDPWPKARHEKRRLTHRRYLASYRDVIRSGGFLAFKTDNEALFDFTLEEIAAVGYEVAEMSRDLHHSPYAAGNVMTEYEEKFAGRGAAINYVKILF